MLNHYLITALWSTSEPNEEFLDSIYDIQDFSKESIKQATKDCELFKQKAGKLLNNLNLSTVGHDFWLTRNGHGAGFWDGDYEESLGIKLTELSKEFGAIDLYIGDDNKLYFM